MKKYITEGQPQALLKNHEKQNFYRTSNIGDFVILFDRHFIFFTIFLEMLMDNLQLHIFPVKFCGVQFFPKKILIFLLAGTEL